MAQPTIPSNERDRPAIGLQDLNTVDSQSSENDVLLALTKCVPLNFQDLSLPELARAIQTKFSINTLVDPAVLNQLDEPISIEYSGTAIPLRSALTLILEPFELTYAVRFDSIIITTVERADRFRRTVVYDVSDLVVSLTSKDRDVPQADFDGLIQVLVEATVPDIWPDGTGNPGISEFSLGDKHLLTIVQTERGHMEIEQLLAQLRKHAATPMPLPNQQP
ncbi:MAG: hypothetical protein R3C28_13365 [Pirellulaceae bacterium]